MKTLIIAVAVSAAVVFGAGAPLAKMYNKFLAPASAGAAESRPNGNVAAQNQAQSAYQQLRQQLNDQ